MKKEKASRADCIAVLKNIKARSRFYDTLYSQYGEKYINDLKEIESNVIDQVISILQSLE